MNATVTLCRAVARAQGVVMGAQRAASTSSRLAQKVATTPATTYRAGNSRGGYGRIQAQSLRAFSTSRAAQHNHLEPPKPGEELHITFIDKDGDESTFEVASGDNLLDIALEHDIEMEGACGGSCACSTCHVIVEDEALYDQMEEPDDDENDMLDLAFGLTETSRLGCQVKMSRELDGLRVRLPSMTRNLQASDFESKK